MKNKIYIYVYIVFLLLVGVCFSNVIVSASSISYYDLVSYEGYELTNENLPDIGLQVNGSAVDYDQVSISKIDSENYNLTYSKDNYTYVFQVEVRQSTGLDYAQQVQFHSLEVDDNTAILNNVSTVTKCRVNNDINESIDLNLNFDFNEVGIHGSNLSCNTSDIQSTSSVNVINTNDESVYNISGQDVLYAQKFHLIEDLEIESINSEQILEEINAQSTRGNVSVVSVNDDFITISDSLQQLNVEVIHDLKPEIEMDKFYQISTADEFNLLDEIEISDDYTKEDELEITYDPNLDLGINIKEIKVADFYGNVTEEKTVILVNDGSYVVSDNEYFIFENKLNTIDVLDENLNLNIFDIADMSYEDSNFNIVQNSYDNQDIVISDVENSYEETAYENNDYLIELVVILIFISLFIVIAIIF